jgi:hypothetical protein
LKAAVLKTVEVERLPGVRIPSSPPPFAHDSRDGLPPCLLENTHPVWGVFAVGVQVDPFWFQSGVVQDNAIAECTIGIRLGPPFPVPEHDPLITTGVRAAFDT